MNNKCTILKMTEKDNYILVQLKYTDFIQTVLFTGEKLDFINQYAQNGVIDYSFNNPKVIALFKPTVAGWNDGLKLMYTLAESNYTPGVSIKRTGPFGQEILMKEYPTVPLHVGPQEPINIPHIQEIGPPIILNGNTTDPN